MICSGEHFHAGTPGPSPANQQRAMIAGAGGSAKLLFPLLATTPLHSRTIPVHPRPSAFIPIPVHPRPSPSSHYRGQIKKCIELPHTDLYRAQPEFQNPITITPFASRSAMCASGRSMHGRNAAEYRQLAGYIWGRCIATLFTCVCPRDRAGTHLDSWDGT